MIWTKETPTEPGWYWIFFYDANEIGICRIILRNEKLMVAYFDSDFDGFDHCAINYIKAFWFGPIKAPF